MGSRGVLILLALALDAPTASAQTAQPQTPVTCPEVARAIETVVRQDIRLRDWANLGRYRDQNRTIVKPPAAQRRVVTLRTRAFRERLCARKPKLAAVQTLRRFRGGSESGFQDWD